MRKLTIVILIILVILTLGAVIFLNFGNTDVRYVCDSSATTSTALLEKRLYSSGVDEEKINEIYQSLLTTSFTEDEFMETALKAGNPEFYPWFSFQISHRDGGMVLSGNMGQELFEGQDGSDYEITNVMMEVTTDSASINAEDTVVYAISGLESEAERAAPVFAEDGSSLAAKLDRRGAYNIAFDGTGGTVMVQYTYDVSKVGFIFDKTVLEDQILQVYITVTTQADGTLAASYEVVDASEVSELY